MAVAKVTKTTTSSSTWEELLTAPTTGATTGVMCGLNILDLHILAGSSKRLASAAKATLASLPCPVLLEDTARHCLEYIDWATLKGTAFTGCKFLNRGADSPFSDEDYRAGCIVQPGNILIASGLSVGGEDEEDEDRARRSLSPREQEWEEILALDGASSWVEIEPTEDDGAAMLPLGDGRVVKIGCWDNAARVCDVLSQFRKDSRRCPSSVKIGCRVWTDLASMSEFRKDFAFAKLHDGRIIVAGGDPLAEFPLAEILDVDANTWTDAKIPSHIDPHEGRHGVVLNDGRFILLSAKGKFVAAFDPSASSGATNNGWVCRSSECGGWPEAPPVARVRVGSDRDHGTRDMIPACVGGNVLLFPSGPHVGDTSTGGGVRTSYSAFLLNSGKWVKVPIRNPNANGVIRIMQWHGS